MGWRGSARDVMFEHIVSRRYGDLQDSSDPQLFNANIHVDDVKDLGPRVGVARDKGVAIRSADVLSSDNLTLSNVYASFDSEFILQYVSIRPPVSRLGLYECQISRHPDGRHHRLDHPGHHRSRGQFDNVGMVFSNVQVQMNRWAESDRPIPTIAGRSNNVSLDMEMSAQSVQIAHRQYGLVSSTLMANPTTVRIDSANNYDFNPACKSSSQISRASLRVNTQ